MSIPSIVPRAAFCVSFLTVVLGVAGCGSSSGSMAASSPTTTSTTTPANRTTTAVMANAITIENFAFGSPVTVKAGAMVTVKNADTTTHSLSADDGSFDAGNIFAGTTTSFAAPMQAGSYKFHCNFHANMHGTLVVTG